LYCYGSEIEDFDEGSGEDGVMRRVLMDVVVVRRVGVGRVSVDVLNCVLVVRA
jgi:hypothetical protein